MTPSRTPRTLTSRFRIVAAAVIGFAIGAAGLAVAQHSDPTRQEASSDTTAARQLSTTIDDGPGTTARDGPGTTIDDGPDTTIDDGPGSTIDDGPDTTVGTNLPEPFTTSYTSAGGSIDVTWSGTAFRLNSISPAPGFRAEIEHQSWDRVRVDFEGDDDDARIEVRINDGQLRIRID